MREWAKCANLSGDTAPDRFDEPPKGAVILSRSTRGCSSMVEPQSSKLITRVRFPSSPLKRNPLPNCSGADFFVARWSPGATRWHCRAPMRRFGPKIATSAEGTHTFATSAPGSTLDRNRGPDRVHQAVAPRGVGLHVWQTVHQYSFLPPMSSITIVSLPHTRHVWPTRP